MLKNVTGNFRYDDAVSGPAADVWSSGCVLYTMVTEELPFGPAVFDQHELQLSQAVKMQTGTSGS